MALTHSFFIIVAAMVLVVQVWASPRTLSGTSMVERHHEWMSRFGRSYKDAAEESHRFKVFKKNVEFIDSFNQAGNHSYKLAVNSHADFTHDEFMATRTGFRMPSQSIHNTSSSSFRYANTDMNEIPAHVDWRTNGAVTDIKNQGSCGCCWAFAAVAAIEGLNQLTTRNLVSLSEQEVVDCETSESYGCQGGFYNGAFELVIRNGGLSTESEYPYQGAQGSCNMERDSSRFGKIRGLERVPEYSESALMKAVANQPVAVSIDASGYDFKYYSSGVFTGECGTQLNHAVTVVGYGESSEGIKYWLVKNSWGEGWGESGYLKIQRESRLRGGLCGIAMRASYPTA